jgi:hypothetical protein
VINWRKVNGVQSNVLCVIRERVRAENKITLLILIHVSWEEGAID